MSLAMYAAPFNDNSNNQYLNEENNTQSANKKRQPHNKTQRKPLNENFDVKKVNSVLEEIHNNSNEEDDNSNNLGDFNPPPPPDSSGVNKTIASEQSLNLSNTQNKEMFKLLGRAPQPNDDNTNINYSLNSYNSNYGDGKSVEEYYKKMLPGYESRLPVNKPYYNMNYSNSNHSNNSNYYNKMDNSNNDILLQKLNYMIHLLEEKQDEKTNNVMEEVILYSFLGIFIIFVVDSFARVGKYVR